MASQRETFQPKSKQPTKTNTYPSLFTCYSAHKKKYAKNLSRSKKKLAQELTNLRERTREGRTREKAVNAQISS